METLWCGQNYITAILIPIQQNNSFTHFLSYNPFVYAHCGILSNGLGGQAYDAPAIFFMLY